MKSLLGAVSTLAALLFAHPASALVILQYQYISDSTPAATSTSPDIFEQHLDMIAQAGLDVVDLDTVTRLLRRRKAPPENAVLITFDGGHSSVYSEAYPRLKSRGWPFVVFTRTQAVDGGKAGYLGWAQLLEMADNGAAIANNSVSGALLARRPANVPEAMWRAQAQREIQYAEARILTNVRQQHKVFAFPLGEYNEELQSLLDALEFLGVSRTPGVVDRRDGLAMPRFPMTGADGRPEALRDKLIARPMAIDSLRLRDEDGDRLRDGALPADVTQPILEIQLDDRDLQAGLVCRSNGEPLSRREDRRKLLFQATSALPAGRSRYDCSARDEASGEVFWFSVAFLRPNPDGSWPASR